MGEELTYPHLNDVRIIQNAPLNEYSLSAHVFTDKTQW